MATDVSSAYKTLADVAEQARRHAKGLPAQVDVRHYWSGIGFKLFGHRFIAPMAEVTEMLDLPHFTALPGVHHWLRGVANVRGRLLPLTDLAGFLGGKLEAARRDRRVLVVEQGDIFSGLIVDGVWGIQHFPVDTYVTEMHVPDHAALLPHLQGSFRPDDGSNWTVFSPWSLLKDDKFSQVGIAG